MGQVADFCKKAVFDELAPNLRGPSAASISDLAYSEGGCMLSVLSNSDVEASWAPCADAACPIWMVVMLHEARGCAGVWRLTLDNGLQVRCQVLVHTVCSATPVELAWSRCSSVTDLQAPAASASGLNTVINGAGWEQVLTLPLSVCSSTSGAQLQMQGAHCTESTATVHSSALVCRKSRLVKNFRRCSIRALCCRHAARCCPKLLVSIRLLCMHGLTVDLCRHIWRCRC